MGRNQDWRLGKLTELGVNIQFIETPLKFVIFHSKLTIALAAFSRRNLEMMCLCGWLVDGGVFLKLDNGEPIFSKP